MGRNSSRISRRVLPSLLLFLLLLLGTTPQCEARALRHSRRNSLMNALFKLNFVREVEPTSYLPPPANASTQDGDAASLAAADCVNPPNAPPSSSTPPFTSTGPSSSIPSAPDQLPPITPIPPTFEPSPPAGTTTPGSSPGTGPPTFTSTPISPPQFAPSPPGTAPPSPIVVVPSPPNDSGPGSGGGGNEGGGGGGFMPPIIYPPPLAPPMAPGAGQALWCVAKPTVPDPILQEAMDYACGSGAECRSIQPTGACSEPDTVLAHASYAFNSYWQMTRAAGGTCDFGGTATIVTSDPSYDQCAFNLV
ncbi:hypothetical protein ACQ4PT_009869 [Festuca glaucescens]